MKPEVLLFHPPNILDPKALKKAVMYPLMYGYGLLHIAAYIKKLHYNIECWNIPLAYYYGLNNDNIEEKIKGYNPILIAIELNWLHLSKGALDLIDYLKKLFPNSLIVVGGVHATIFAEEIMRSNNMIDIVVKGEAEQIMQEILEKLNNNRNINEIPGTISRSNGKIVNNEGKNIIEDINKIPPYSIDYLRPKKNDLLSRKNDMNSKGKILNPDELAMVNTCRGPCVYNCTHCVGSHIYYSLSSRSKITFHSCSWVIDQIQKLIELGFKRIGIQDYCYSNPQFINELAKAIQKEKLSDSLEFFNFALVPTEQINYEILNNLAKAGVDNIDVGIESGSDRILSLLRRPYNTQQASAFIKNAVKSGIITKTFWMITGFENQDDLAANQNFLKSTIEMGGIPKWVTSLCILPQTQLFKNSEKYQLKMRFSSFNDYLKFSTEQCNRNAYYPNLMTHETNSMNVFDILKAVNDFKSAIIHNKGLIIEKQKEIMKYLSPVHPKLDENQLIQRIEAGLESLRGTFF